MQGDPSTIPPEIQAGANIYSNVSNGSNDTTSADSVIAAASAAARINAMMIAKGMGAKVLLINIITNTIMFPFMLYWLKYPLYLFFFS